ncbi:MAG: UDP-N-acetylmuramoyl-L-alanyl-D-glutamate--2,6-diaminopimelate ligase [Eubacteriales bacterium]|nr:UDP-N-acetylmuramoyl-L-alanyl-D-glutamate--2,6-diaminopimelate ligase [Eubacteriales bacterium]
MVVREILKIIDYLEFSGDSSLVADNITYDSRKTDSNTIFSAIKGFKKDGHQFINSAFENGCRVVLCESIPDRIEGMSYIVVQNSRSAMADISYALNMKGLDMDLVGVTGTNGKTSITYLLKSIYEFSGLSAGIIGTMGALLGDKKISLDNTTPEAPDLHNILKAMATEGIKHCFMEVSSHSTALFRVKNLKFSLGIFTNLTEDHLIFHETMENYYQAKKKFFYQCEKSIINIDDPYGKRLFGELTHDGKSVVSYSAEEKADYLIDNIEIDRTGSRFNLQIGQKKYYVNLRTPGKFNVYNYTAAIATGVEAGLNAEYCIKALEAIKGVEGRFEFVDTTLDCTVILDFAHTPDGLEKVMETINQFATGRKVVLFGAQGERDIARRALMGEVAGKFCDFVMITSDNPVYEDPMKICLEITKGIEKYHDNYKIILDREEAIDYLIENYQHDDIILLAGKSTEPYQMIEDRKVPYDEKRIALSAIRKKEQKQWSGK